MTVTWTTFWLIWQQERSVFCQESSIFSLFYMFICMCLVCLKNIRIFHLSPFTCHLGFVHPLQDVALHQCLPLSSVAFLFQLSPRLCPSTTGCSPPSVSSIVFCLLLSCFTFHLGCVRPPQDVALHQCLPLSSVCCFPVSPFT